MQNPARKHHYIPEFYTKWWAGTDGRVERFTKHRHIVDRRVHPARVGWQWDLYQIPHTDGPEAQAVEERFFRQLDDIASVALKKMNASPMVQLDVRETSAWSVFMMSLLHRTPEYLSATKETSRRMWQEMIPEVRERYETLRTSTDPETFEEYVAQRDPAETDRSLMWNLPHLIANARIGSVLNQMEWHALDVPVAEPSLLLSDDPLARTNGILNPGGHLAMPLSPRRLLVVAHEADTMRSIDRMPIRQLVKNMNKWTVESARHFVVATDLSQAPFIRKRFGTNPKTPLNAQVT